jgi:starvation-inducible DNA-binding protein
MNVAIGITEANRLVIATELSKMLADETILYIKTKNAHWNVEGPDFYAIHKFFEAQFEQLDEIIDNVAERIRTLGHYAPGTLKAYLGLTHLTEQTRSTNDSQGLIKDLLLDHESIIINLRENIKSFATEHYDLGTSDFITGLVETHEKMSWFLRAHVVK